MTNPAQKTENPSHPESLPERFYIRDEILKMGRISNTTLWRLLKSGDFPQPVRLGSSAGAARWSRKVVDDWFDSLEETA